MSFLNSLWVEYPIPKEVSIWSGSSFSTGSEPVCSLSDLVVSCLQEISSDLFITEYLDVYGSSQLLPASTKSVVSAKLLSPYNFQGNRYVKFSYDPLTRQVYLRYYPARITYRRTLLLSDLPGFDESEFPSFTTPEGVNVNVNNSPLSGDALIYVRSYIFMHMAEKELAVLKTVNFSADNATIDYGVLESFLSKKQALYDSMKPEILIYPGQP